MIEVRGIGPHPVCPQLQTRVTHSRSAASANFRLVKWLLFLPGRPHTWKRRLRDMSTLPFTSVWNCPAHSSTGALLLNCSSRVGAAVSSPSCSSSHPSASTAQRVFLEADSARTVRPCVVGGVGLHCEARKELSLSARETDKAAPAS